MTNEREVIIENPDEASLADRMPQTRPEPDLPVSKAASMAKSILRQLSFSEEDDEACRAGLNDLVNRLCNQQTLSGDADDFHNFVVALARKDEYALACRLLARGLEIFPKNVDLLADYLQYGVSCGRAEECKRYSKILMKIPRMRWTWRGFAFLVRYLLHLTEQSDSEKDILAKRAQMLEIVADFKKYFPYSEEPYRVEAEVYQSLNEPERESAPLRQAMSVLKVCPKCALRYADLQFERGNYGEAMVAIQRAIRDANQTQSSISEGYIYYLSALCRIAMIQAGETGPDEQVVRDVYSDFNIAIRELGEASSYFEVIRTKTNTLVSKSGIDIPPELVQLYNACPKE